MLGILNGTTAFLTTVIAYFWLNEAISMKQIIGLCLGFLGVLILVNPANGSSTFIASMCALIGSLCYAFNGNYLQKYHANSNKKVLIGWSMLFGGLIMTPIAAFNLPESLPNLNSFLLATFANPSRRLLAFFVLPLKNLVNSISTQQFQS